jgi:hypothetical protein
VICLEGPGFIDAQICSRERQPRETFCGFRCGVGLGQFERERFKNSREKRDALRNFITYDAIRWQYIHGVKNPELVSPDGSAHDQFLLDRSGNDEIQLDLFLSYGSNPLLYPTCQSHFRTHQPPMLIAWGTHDQIFPAAGAEPYKRDLKTLEYHLLDAGHFALKTNVDEDRGSDA